MKHILIVEDDPKLNDGIRLALGREQYTFSQCGTMQEAAAALEEQSPDLVLLDLNLPDGSGLALLARIRRDSCIPVIIITANHMEIDIVTGLESGANDYITKPFSLAILRARVAVQLRERRKMRRESVCIGPYDFDFEKMIYKRDGVPVELSKTEQRLLRILCENAGATLTRSQLIDYVWAGDGEFVEEHALTVTVKRLRDKLSDTGMPPEYIKTVYGIGYTWAVK